jgi:Flp pilus assembly protein TadG
MKNLRDQQRRRHATRRGVLSMELALTLPILGVVIFGLFEFTLLLYARGHVVEASRAAARQATLPGVTPDDVETTAAQILPARLRAGMTVATDLGTHSGDVVWVAVRVPMTAAAPDLLWPIGISLHGRTLHSETRMLRE